MKKKLIKQLDKIFSEIIRAGGYCQRCGEYKPKQMLHAAHIFPRTHKRLRWNLNNAFCLCYRCHIHWWHQNPIEATKWASSVRDIGELEEIYKINKPVKEFEMEEWLENLKKKRAEYGLE